MIPEVYSTPATGAEIVILMAMAIGALAVALLLALAVDRVIGLVAGLVRRLR